MRDPIKDNPNKHAESYSEEKFWDKVKNVVKKAGTELIENAFVLYYCLQDKDTPMWAKSVVIGALGYFISPIDFIPDYIPGVGLTDDAAVIAGAIYTVSQHIKKEHTIKAKKQTANLFSKL